MSDSLQPHGLYSPWNSPAQNTRVSSLSLLQGIFPTQGSNPGLPHCRWILYQLSHKESPYVKYSYQKKKKKSYKTIVIIKRMGKTLGGDRCLWLVVMISWACTYSQTHLFVYIKYVPHFRCQSYLKKVVKKISVCLVSGRYHKSQAIYLESKDNQKLSCLISSVGANEVRTELPHPLGMQSGTNLQCKHHHGSAVESLYPLYCMWVRFER